MKAMTTSTWRFGEFQIFQLGDTASWREAARRFPSYATLIDIALLALLSILLRREGAGLLDLIGFDRACLRREVLYPLLLIGPTLVFILGGIAGASLVVYGPPEPPASIFTPLPFPAALYAATRVPVERCRER
jgi:hypothetical protein